MTLEELTAKAESGPYCFLYREALRKNYVDYSGIRRVTGTWATCYISGDVRRWEAWLCEALATALEHPDRVLATRAAWQAQEYATRLIQLGYTIGGPCWHDALKDALERSVSWVKESISLTVERDAALAKIAELELAEDTFSW